MNSRDKVREYYNRHSAEEDQRLDEHPFELPVTMHFIDKYLKKGAKIFDAACGTGRIADTLLKKGFKVGMNDLSDKNVEISRKRLEDQEGFLFCRQADALKSTDWNQEEWDCILLLGPLYHLPEYKKRLKLMKLASGSVKNEGYVFSSFMSRTLALVYGLKNNPEGIAFKDGVNMLWEKGTDKDFVMDTEWFTQAYFAHPEEINPLMEEAGLESINLAGAEGIFGERFELYHKLDNNLKKHWMKFIIKNCEDKHMIHQSKHLLSVCRKN